MKLPTQWMDVGRQLADHVLNDPRFSDNLVAVGAVLALIAVVWLVARRILSFVATHAVDASGVALVDSAVDTLARKARELLAWITFTATVGTVFLGIAYHAAGRDAFRDARAWYEQLTAEQLVALALLASELVGLAIAAKLCMNVARRAARWLEGIFASRVALGDDGDKALARGFRLIEVYAQTAVALGAALVAARLLGFGAYAQPVAEFLFRVMTIVSVARLVAMGLRAGLPPLLMLGDRRLAATFFRNYWERLSRLAPFAERCLEMAIYVMTATMLINALKATELVTMVGPRIVHVIGIVLGTRVVVELLQVVLYESFGLYDESKHDQRRQTLIPLLNSAIQYGIYIGAAVMTLNVFEVPIGPVLTGLGIGGLVVGLAAQSLISDLISGLFLLLDNQFLVGDYVEIGSAKGVVEAIAVRHTQVRDEAGKLHIIPNGQIKAVVNYSKGYLNAVVSIKAPLDSDIDALFRAMTEAGQTLRRTRRDVLADTVVQGMVEMNLADMTLRASTKVRPGAHAVVESEYRRLLREILERNRATSNAAVARAA